MSRRINKRKGRTSIAVIVDGKDEKWYMEKVKKHYSCTVLKYISIKPELPSKKKVVELFDLAKTKVEAENSMVLLIIDLDEVLKSKSELNNFKNQYEKYLNAHQGKPARNCGWMKKLLVIVNNPCLEYWYLLHFYPTRKFYADYAGLKKDLRKNLPLSQYEKTEEYYNSNPDIYKRLESWLKDARSNATPFDVTQCTTQGCSEMGTVFDCLDNYNL